MLNGLWVNPRHGRGPRARLPRVQSEGPNKNVFRNLYVDPTSETWFLNKHIEAEIKKKLDKTRGQLASDEMEYDIIQYIDCLQHDPSWVGRRE